MRSRRPICSFQGCGHIYHTFLTCFKNLLLQKNKEPNTGEVASAGEVAGPSEKMGHMVQSLWGMCVQQCPQQGTEQDRVSKEKGLRDLNRMGPKPETNASHLGWSLFVIRASR